MEETMKTTIWDEIYSWRDEWIQRIRTLEAKITQLETRLTELEAVALTDYRKAR
jgi:hypothetical protein